MTFVNSGECFYAIVTWGVGSLILILLNLLIISIISALVPDAGWENTELISSTLFIVSFAASGSTYYWWLKHRGQLDESTGCRTLTMLRGTDHYRGLIARVIAMTPSHTP